MKYCQKCGGQIPEGTNECPICGLVVESTTTPQQITIAPVMDATPQPAVAAPTTEAPAPAPVQPAAPAPGVTPAPVVTATPVAPTPLQNTNPVYTPPVQMPAQNQTTTKSNGVPIILVIILLVVVAAAGMVLGKVLFGGPKEEKKETDNTQEVASEKEEEKEDEDEEYVASSSQTVVLEKHKITIPDDYKYEMDEELLYIGDDSENWVIQLAINMGDFDATVTKLPEFISMMEESGATVGNIIDQTFEGKIYKTIEMTVETEKALFGLTKLSDKYYAMVMIVITGDADSTTVLKNAASILSTAEEQSSRSVQSSFSMPEMFSNVEE